VYVYVCENIEQVQVQNREGERQRPIHTHIHAQKSPVDVTCLSRICMASRAMYYVRDKHVAYMCYAPTDVTGLPRISSSLNLGSW